MQRLILHSVGTSLLTNRADQADAQFCKKIKQVTNQQASEIEPAERQQMTSLLDTCLSEIDTLQKGTSASAELAGLARLYTGETMKASNDIHFLVHTDTYAGALCADYLARIIKKLGVNNVNKVKAVGLTTKTKAAFETGIKWLINWCEDTLPGYKESKYQIIFNLTGGFKSLQGYLNIMGMFYADKVIYIFETGNELIEIPRLPIRTDTEIVHQSAAAFLLADCGICSKEQVRQIPDIYLDKDEFGELCNLSPIGKLIWSRNKKEILQKELVDLPYISYTDSFRKDFKSADRDPVKLQETLATVAHLLVQNKGDTAALKRHGGGLLYENYQNKRIDGLPIGHFRVTQETRVSCVLRDGVLHMRRFGAHDDVNGNP